MKEKGQRKEKKEGEKGDLKSNKRGNGRWKDDRYKRAGKGYKREERRRVWRRRKGRGRKKEGKEIKK